MKKAAEWAEDKLTSASVHKRHVTGLRRLAGGLKTEIAGAQWSGLNEKEQKTLAAAAELLTDMALVREKAKDAAALRELIRERREKEIKSAISGNFGKLTSIMDKVCLLAAVRPFGCDMPKMEARDVIYLDRYVQDALNELVYTLAGMPGSVSEVVTAAWTKFEAARPGYEIKYAAVERKLFQGKELNHD